MSYDASTISYKTEADITARRNALRFLIDDREPDDERYSDAELDAWMLEWCTVWLAAAELADKEIGQGVTEEDIGSANRLRYLRNMAPTWRARARSHQTPIIENIDATRFVPDGQFRF